MKQRSVTVTEFKAKCLAMLDDLSLEGGSIIVTKRGRPLARVSPARQPKWKSPEGSLAGKVVVDDEALMADMSDLWEAVNPRSRSKR